LNLPSPQFRETTQIEPFRSFATVKEARMQRLNSALGALAALMGAGGVLLAAAATHTGGGEMGQTAAYFLILHAAALLGVTAGIGVCVADVAVARGLLLAGAGLGIGAILFAADLATRAFSGARLFPLAAPIGGSLMILAWLALAAVFIFSAARRRG
jgi:uncharacterized membrane protein YgdD (TMEM256/DUF423 family)